MLRKFLSIAAAFALLAPANLKADDNIGEVRRSVESGGGKVYWGKHIDHPEYAKAVINIAAGNGGGYLADLAAGIAKDFGLQLGADTLNKLVKGETIDLNGKQVRGIVVSYNHWLKEGHHEPRPYWNGPFDNGIRWVYVENKIPLPNTHQFALVIK